MLYWNYHISIKFQIILTLKFYGVSYNLQWWLQGILGEFHNKLMTIIYQKHQEIMP